MLNAESTSEPRMNFELESDFETQTKCCTQF